MGKSPPPIEYETDKAIKIIKQWVHNKLDRKMVYIILLFIPVIGWIALFKILGGSKKQKAVTFAVCPNCGHRKKV